MLIAINSWAVLVCLTKAAVGTLPCMTNRGITQMMHHTNLRQVHQMIPPNNHGQNKIKVTPHIYGLSVSESRISLYFSLRSNRFES